MPKHLFYFIPNEYFNLFPYFSINANPIFSRRVKYFSDSFMCSSVVVLYNFVFVHFSSLGLVFFSI